MTIAHTAAGPRQLPFHAESFEWEHFERFCASYFVSGTLLPNLNLTEEEPVRLRIVDAVRYGTSGSKQRGIDILATMEHRATWVVQCKRMPNFTRRDAETAIAEADEKFSGCTPARYLLWVSGKVSTEAQEVIGLHPNWTLWSGERLSTEFLLHTPRRQSLQIITNIFGPGWAKAFFPLPDELLYTTSDFFSRWDVEDRLFHHGAALVGRADVLERMVKFAGGGKGRKAMILSAAGGIGKTRLLRAIAEEVEGKAPTRLIRFLNPDASEGAEPPRDEEASSMTVFHDDAHRMDISGLLLKILVGQQSDGSRLVLATRPGAEDALRERLMNAGYSSIDIEQLEIKRLNKSEMVELAASRLGTMDENVARSLAELSGGCALVTLVGAELLRRGDLTHLDLNRSDRFRDEVFHRFEGQELERLRGSVERPLMEKLLRSIALLSPWDHREKKNVEVMSEYIGILRGQIEAVCDTLIISGLVIQTHHGLRLTPDLFSDHLVYVFCYDSTGGVNKSVDLFLQHFQSGHSNSILNNLAGAEWRAIQKHGNASSSVVAPIWQQFLRDFAATSFWERSRMLDKWSAFAIYQPERSVELARWAMDLDTAEGKSGYAEFDRQDQVLRYLPGLLRPVAIWSDSNRRAALDVFWRLKRDFPMGESLSSPDRFADFATIASFSHGNSAALVGVLDWLDQLMEGEDASLICEKPCSLIDVVLRPFFAQVIKRTFNRDKQTVVFSTILVSVSRTKSFRDRVLTLIMGRIVPRGTVAAINALPVLAEAYRQTDTSCELPDAAKRAWRPERLRALQLISEVAKRYPHPLIHFTIRRHLHWQAVYGKDEKEREGCQAIVGSMPKTNELNLARLTLSWSHDDSFLAHDENNREWWHEQCKNEWLGMLEGVVDNLVENHPTASGLHHYLVEWNQKCLDHGLQPKFGELLSEIARLDQTLACRILDVVVAASNSTLAENAANLISAKDWKLGEVIDVIVGDALASGQSSVVCSFLRAIQFEALLQSVAILRSLFSLAKTADGMVLQSLFAMIAFPAKRDWTEDLVLTLANRSMTDDQIQDFADTVWHKLRYGEGDISESAIIRIMERMMEVLHFKTSYEQAGFVYEISKRFPRATFQMFVKRIERQEQERAAGRGEFEALPYGTRVSFAGLDKELDFEELAEGVLDVMMQRKHEDRDPWRRLFIMAVSRSSPLIESLLMARLLGVKSSDDLVDLATLTGFEGSLVVFRSPLLVEAMLLRARGFGPDVFSEITWKLIGGAGPKNRSYSGGELEPEYCYLRKEAEKAVHLHKSNPVLAPFYQEIVNMEVADAERNRKMQEVLMADDW